jgi:hypothetical protein
MKLSGQISIDLPVGDYFTTADHRQQLEDILSYIRKVYPDASLAIRERRERRTMHLSSAAPRAATGALNLYAED